jgi:2,3-bisphosphoglycerate-independent phosphoglycerate mutase
VKFVTIRVEIAIFDSPNHAIPIFMKQIIYIVLDGLADLPIDELDDKTPLEAAATPKMDRLAGMGRTGLVYPVAKDIAPESDIAVISLLGYEANKYYTGRGPLEAFAEGLSVSEGNLALRVNFATVDTDGKTIKDRRVGRNLSTEEAGALAKEINSKVTLSGATFEFKNTVGHRGVLVIRGLRSQLSGQITNTDPAYDRQGLFGVARKDFQNLLEESMPMAGYENSLEAKEAALLLNEFTEKSHKVLDESAVNKKRISENKLAANLILSRDAGSSLPKFPQIASLYNNIKFGCFVQMPVERGIALLTGMEIIEVPSSSGHLDVDYQVWSKVALDSVKKYDGIYIHIKGPDEPGHDGDFRKKKEIIEAIDEFFFSNFIAGIDLNNCIICITSDHSTVCKIKAHSSVPVPLLIAGGGIRPDGTLSFSEKTARLGSLGELKGQEILPLLVKYAHAQS